MSPINVITTTTIYLDYFPRGPQSYNLGKKPVETHRKNTDFFPVILAKIETTAK